MKSICLFFLALSFATSSSSFAKELDVASAYWRGYSEPGGHGIYLEIIKLIYPEFKTNFHVGSFARAKRQFMGQKVDILVGIFKEDQAQLGATILSTFHIDMEYPVIAIYDPQRHKIMSSADFKGLVVGWYEEYNYARYAGVDSTIINFNEIVNGLALLESGRIDVVIDHIYNLSGEQKSKLATLELEGEKPLWLAFSDTPNGRNLRAQFDAGMRKLLKSGQLQVLYGEEFERANFNQKY